MKLKPISAGQALDLMREGKVVAYKAVSHEGRQRICEGYRQYKPDGSDRWIPCNNDLAATSNCARFFDIGEPRKLVLGVELTTHGELPTHVCATLKALGFASSPVMVTIEEV